MAGQTQVPYEGDRKPGGDSPSACTTGEEAGRGRRSLQREERRRAFRFLFFSALFFPLLRVASPPAIFRGDFSLGAISHPRRAPADVAAWAVDSDSTPQRSRTKPSLIIRSVFLSLSLPFFARILHENVCFTWTRRRGEMPRSRFRFSRCGLQGKSKEIAHMEHGSFTAGSCANARTFFSLFFFLTCYICRTAKYGSSMFMERGNNVHVVRNGAYVRTLRHSAYEINQVVPICRELEQ